MFFLNYNKSLKNRSIYKNNNESKNINTNKINENEIKLKEEQKKQQELEKAKNIHEQKQKYVLKELKKKVLQIKGFKNKYCKQINKKINKKVYSIIPLNIFHFWHDLELLPDEIKKNISVIKLQNPEFTHYLYDISMCREFLKNNFEEDILYTFDKLASYKHKMYLWCFCILYVRGGFFIDTKYTCHAGFKLLELTDKEYYCKDENNINLDLIISLPNNPVMNKCIKEIVINCKKSFYGTNKLEIIKNQLITCFFHEKINKIPLVNSGNIIKNYVTNHNILYKNIDYKDYYTELWNKVECYNYPILKYNTRVNLSKTINTTIFNEKYKFYSGSPTIVLSPYHKNNYIINIRYINYTFKKTSNNDKEIMNKPNHFITINSIFEVDENFNKITKELFLDDVSAYDETTYKGILYKGIEDLRLFQFCDNLYYLATTFDEKTQKMLISSDRIVFNPVKYTLNKNIIYPTFLNEYTTEKNWSFFDYNNELCIVYKWFPLQIGKIDYDSNELIIIDIKYNIPDYFKEAKGSTCGFKTHDDELWFVIHKSQSKGKFVNYQHFFAVFDLNMNLLRYSELFKFENYKVEFCMGLIIKEKENGCELIMSYSLMDTQSIVCVYDMEYIKNGIKWYRN
jgi:hypothetical protein